MAIEADYRLPRTVVPHRYRIEMVPDLNAATFSGSVEIDVDVTVPTTEIVLNAIELEIESAEISQGSDATGASHVLDEATERLTLRPGRTIDAGQATVRIRFTGILNDQLRGFYRSTYTDVGGNEQVLATTQFESTDARRAFPCWDEPDLKATFSLSLVIPADMTAVSNTSEISREVLEDGRVRIGFAETIVMSTYLVAFVVGDLEATEPVEVNGIPLRIITPPGKLHLTGFALEAGAFALDYFATYYDVPYPGDKLDMVAIPDFGFGAMENLGCITYRETALLVDTAIATQVELARVASVIAHEIAHMWFGDLVKMKWWNGIWLNEAFATFAETKCTAAFRPEWDFWLVFASDRARSQETDALASTRPIEFPVASPEEADAMFDVLTYEKGSSVLRMLELYLTEDRFRAGISLYLQRHAFSNTETADLWAALEEVTGEPVGEIMDTWILQGGYPVVDVESTDDGVVVTQRPFRFIGDGEGEWQIPVLYRSNAGDGRIVLGVGPVTIDADDSVIVNAGGEGFYRVAYDEDLLRSIESRLPELAPIERFSVVSDASAEMLAGGIPASDYLDLVGKLEAEPEIDVWMAAVGGIDELDRIISSDDRDALRSWVRNLAARKADELGWIPEEGESDRTRALRGLILKTLGNLGDDAETVSMARQVEESSEAIDAEVADAALAITAAHGDLSDFERFLRLSETAESPQVLVKYLRAAALVPHPDVPPRLFAMILDGSIRSQDSFWVIALLLGHRENGPRAWRLLTERWDELMAVLAPNHRHRILDSIKFRSEPEVAASITQWFTDHGIPGADRAVAQRLEMIAVRVALREREAERLGGALHPA
jgi:puromycin-sensitive aminopeptidase